MTRQRHFGLKISDCRFAKRGVRPLLVAFLFLLTAHTLQPTALGQSATATLSGTVEDQNGAIVPGVEITIMNPATALERQVTTNDAGYFTVPLLPPGQYVVIARRQGFTAAEIRDLILNVGDQKSLHIQLKTGDVKETVNITGESPLINESPSVGTVVDRRFVENMPLNGRSFQTLIQLTPGVVLTKSTFGEQGQFSVNGQRADANYFTVDGVSANVLANSGASLGQSAGGALPGLTIAGGTSSLVSVDAMEEFRIQTSTFAPEFGRTPGGQIQIITRSGTNQFHGTVFDFLRNDVLDAKDWFANANNLTKPAERQNDFGGVFGGPIIKNKTFFFFSYEGLRLRQPQTAVTVVPSVTSRQAAPALLQPFLNAYPMPNGATLANGFAQFAATYSNPATVNATSIRLDHALNSKISLFVRYNYAPSHNVSRGPTLSVITNALANTQTLTFGSTQTLKTNLLNEVRANYSKQDSGSKLALDSFGGATPPSDSTVFPSFVTPSESFFLFSITGAGSLSLGRNALNGQRQVNLLDNLSWSVGSHQLKFGADYRRLSPKNGIRSYGQTVSFSGINGATGTTAGKAASVTVTAQQPATLTFTNFSVYGQDTWKATPRLTITYGLRWDVNPPIKGKNGKEPVALQNIDSPATLSLAAPGTALYNTTYKNLAPRVGVVYLLRQRNDWETILRGGFGVFYDLGLGTTGNATGFFPFQSSKSVGSVPFPITADQATPLPFSLSPPFGTIFGTDPNLKLPRTYEWNVSAEQSLWKNQIISATYVGAVGRKLLRMGAFLRPNSNFSSTVQITGNSGTSDYHALQLQLKRRLSRGFQVLASYTWAHSIDNGSADSSNFVPGITINPQLDRGDSDYDIRHSLTAAISYDIPKPSLGIFGKVLLQDWSIDTFILARSAPPVDLSAGIIVPLSGSAVTARPNVMAGIPLYLYGRQYPGGRIFNNTVPTAAQVSAAGCATQTATNAKGAFCTPTSGQGSLGRNVVRGFPASQVNFAVRRQFHLLEKLNLQFRAEFFNIFNHPNFGNPVNVITSPVFGQSNQTLAQSLGSGGTNGGFSPLYQIGGSRSIQFGLKLQF